MSQYVHMELNRDVPAPSGYYVPRKEARLAYDGRDVLYTINEAVIESSCCGASDFASALVPGFIVKWRAGTNNNGLSVSEVEPISDEKIRDDIRRIIREVEHVTRVEFW
jgi:hypothetical protein